MTLGWARCLSCGTIGDHGGGAERGSPGALVTQPIAQAIHVGAHTDIDEHVCLRCRFSYRSMQRVIEVLFVQIAHVILQEALVLKRIRWRR